MFQTRLNISVLAVILTTVILIAAASGEKAVTTPDTLKVGMLAPDFTLKDEEGIEQSLSDYLGKKNIVLAFYPKDFTGGWTAELCSLRDNLSEIEATESVLFGVSVDDVKSHKRFREAEKFGFSLLADTEFEVSKQYSGIIERFNASKRTTFIIDKAGYIRAIDREVNVKTHGEDVAALLKKVLPKIEAGQPAPDFVATDSTGKIHQLSALIEEKKNVVLSFYPRDFGRGWTAQVCSLRDESSSFAKYDAQIFGITHNDAESHAKFSEENQLNFPLLVDTGRNLALLYGATDAPDGKIQRMAIIIDKAGKIVEIDKKVNASTHGTDLVNFFTTLETSN